MITGKEGMLSSLTESFLMEKGMKLFYERAVEKSANRDARKMFGELRDWEGTHMDYIQFLYQSLTEDRDLTGFEEFRTKSVPDVTEAGIPLKELEAGVEEHTFTDDAGAVAFAMKMEGKAYNLYHGLSKSAEDDNARIIFREMMEQEAAHIDYLKKLKSRLPNAYSK